MKTYSPDKVKIVAGPHAVSGYADGTFVSVTQITDGVVSESGADGEVARAMSTDKRMRITLTLQQVSSSNAVLSAMYDADQLSGGDYPFPFTMSDLRGQTLLTAGSAWIVKKADAEFGKELSTREWVFETDKAAYTVGGN